MNLAFTYVITLSEAITFWLVIAIIAVAAFICALYEFANVINNIRKRAFDRRIAKIERKLKEKQDK